jgi:hypothetical protein
MQIMHLQLHYRHHVLPNPSIQIREYVNFRFVVISRAMAHDRVLLRCLIFLVAVSLQVSRSVSYCALTRILRCLEMSM